MGQQSAKPELDQEIRYRFKGYPDEVELVFANLKNRHRFSKKIPSDSILKKQFEAFLSKLIANQDSKRIIENLPKKYKWRLLCKHEEILSGKANKHITKSTLQKLMDRMIEEQSVYAFNNFFSQIETERAMNEDLFWKDFKNYRGPQILIEILSSQQMFANNNGSHELLIKLLEFLHYVITTFDQGIEYLKRANNGIQTIVSCINPLHPVVTGYVFDITAQFLLGNDEDLENVCRGFSDYKKNHGLASRFQVIVEILKCSPNVILIRNTLQFLISFISLPSNKSRAKLIRQEFLELGIEHIFEMLLSRIKRGKYLLKDCTEEAYLKRLKNKQQDMFNDDDNFIDANNTNLKAMLKSKQLLGITSDSIPEEEEKPSENRNDKTQAEDDDNSDEEDEEQENPDTELQQLSVTLTEKDGNVFELHLKGIQDAISLFLTLNLEEEVINQNDSNNSAPKEYSFDTLTEKLKKKAFENDCYDQLTGSLQKLLLLPNDREKVNKVFISLDKALSKIFASPLGVISDKELNSLIEDQQNFEAMHKRLEEAEELNHNKDSEIQGILKDKDEILVKLSQMKHAGNLMEDQIKSLLQEISKLKEEASKIPQQVSPVQPLNNPNNPKLQEIPTAPQLSGIPAAPQLSGIPVAPQLSGIPTAPQLPGIPVAPQLSGIPVAPQLSGIPVAPQLSGIPVAPQLSGIPVAPQLSGIPVAPQLSGIPVAPQLSGIPVAPQLSGIPVAPQLCGIPVAPQLSGIPVAPQLSGIPVAPQLSGIPVAPQLSGIPVAPQLSGIPVAPQLSGIPVAPQLSGIPAAPQLSGIPAAPQLSGIPMAPQLSGIPIAPQLSGIPVAPQLSGIPAAPQLSGIPMAPSLSGIPMAPQLSGIPVAPSLSGIPAAPSLSGIPAAPQFSGIPMPPPFSGIPQAPSFPGVPQAPSFLGSAPVPPPFISSGGMAPPPPMFGMPSMPMAPVGPPQKQKRKPNVALKPFMWNSISAINIKDTIWEKLNDEKVQLDTQFLESQFEKPAPVVKAPAASTAATANTAAATKPIVTLTSLITPERTKTIEIVLHKLKMSPQLLSNALITIDEKILTTNNLQSLLSIMPKPEEIDLVMGFIDGGGKADTLASPEKFIIEIQKVNGFSERIKALYFVRTNAELFSDLEPKVSKLKKAIFFIRDNKIIPEMLEYVLAVGNYLNGESARGGQWGFKFDSLVKISDIKMKDNKTTLMMYVIEVFEKKYTQLISQEDEDALYFLEQLPITQLNADLNEIKKNSRFMMKAIQSQTSAPQDCIKEKIEPSVAAIDQHIVQIETDIKTIEETYKQVSALYCEKPTDPSDRFAEKFGSLFRKIKKEKADKIRIDEAIKKEEQKKQKEEEKRLKDADKKPKETSTASSTKSLGQSQALLGLGAILAGTLGAKKMHSDQQGEAIRGTFLGMQNVKAAGDARMSKCYQNVRETLLMAKNKTDMIDALKEMKMKKQADNQGAGSEKGEDLDSAISKLDFLKK